MRPIFKINQRLFFFNFNLKIYNSTFNMACIESKQQADQHQSRTL